MCSIELQYVNHNEAPPPAASGCEVVAMGTGNVNSKESATPNGRVLHDSHAVVTARRSLMRSASACDKSAIIIWLGGGGDHDLTC